MTYGTTLRAASAASSVSGISSTSASVMMSSARFRFAPRLTTDASMSKCRTIDRSAPVMLVVPSDSMIRTLSSGTK